MNHKKIYITIVLVLILIILGVICFSGYFVDKRPIISGAPNTDKITYVNSSENLIKVELPFPGAVVGKDFSVLGKARGNWFFEASFPVVVLDKDGNVLSTAVAQAKTDWMTTDFVEFKADFNIPQSYIGKATLVLKKDNPSGMPENDASVSFPINIEY